jgi:hypothetical protein
MRYVVTDKKSALRRGIKLIGHIFVGDQVLLNEREVLACHTLSRQRSLETKVKKLPGRILSDWEAKDFIKNSKI